MLQALRGVISGAGKKMGEAVRKSLTTTLLSLLGMPEVSGVIGLPHVTWRCKEGEFVPPLPLKL